MTHSGLPDAEECASHEQGWTHYLERLAVAAAGGDPGPDLRREMGRTPTSKRTIQTVGAILDAIELHPIAVIRLNQDEGSLEEWGASTLRGDGRLPRECPDDRRGIEHARHLFIGLVALMVSSGSFAAPTPLRSAVQVRMNRSRLGHRVRTY